MIDANPPLADGRKRAVRYGATQSLSEGLACDSERKKKKKKNKKRRPPVGCALISLPAETKLTIEVQMRARAHTEPQPIGRQDRDRRREGAATTTASSGRCARPDEISQRNQSRAAREISRISRESPLGRRTRTKVQRRVRAVASSSVARANCCLGAMRDEGALARAARALSEGRQVGARVRVTPAS